MNQSSEKPSAADNQQGREPAMRPGVDPYALSNVHFSPRDGAPELRPKDFDDGHQLRQLRELLAGK